MTQTKTKETRRILAFSPLKKLIVLFASQLQAAKVLGVRTPTIKAACDGKAISTCHLYLRWWDPEIEIDFNKELGVLTLKEYDELCGVERRVYNTRRMDRTGMKYNMKATPEKLKRLKKKENNESQNCQQL